MLAGIVFLDFEKIFLSMGADLDDVFCLDVELDLFPVAAVLFEGVEEGLMLSGGPVFAMFGYDVGFAGLLCGKSVRRKGRRD